MGTLANSEDPDKMPHISSGSALFAECNMCDVYLFTKFLLTQILEILIVNKLL